MKVSTSLIFIACFFTLNVSAQVPPVKKDTIVGVLDFGQGVDIKKVAEAGKRLAENDSNFTSIVVGHVAVKAHGIHFIYKLNKKISTIDMLTEEIKTTLKPYSEIYKGSHMGGETITIK
jgi:hypothetical protein